MDGYPSGGKSRSAISVDSISRCNSSMNYIHRYKLKDIPNYPGIYKRQGRKLKKLISYSNKTTARVVAVLYRLYSGKKDFLWFQLVIWLFCFVSLVIYTVFKEFFPENGRKSNWHYYEQINCYI